MARPSTTPHTVHLFNFVGEKDDVAQYQECIIDHCYCNIRDGAANSTSGKKTADSAALYIIKHGSRVQSPDGIDLEYLPFEAWMAMQEHDCRWTINPNGKDYFTLEGHGGTYRVVSFEDNDVGSRRVRHYKVVGR